MWLCWEENMSLRLKSLIVVTNLCLLIWAGIFMAGYSLLASPAEDVDDRQTASIK